MYSIGETKATDLPSREDWIAVATAPEVEPYTTMSYISGNGDGPRSKFYSRQQPCSNQLNS